MGYIYKIFNDINKKIYIGKTTSTINKRWLKHQWAYLNYDWHLYRAMRKYGIEHFYIEEVEKCEDIYLNEREKYWIKQYDSYHNGYNSTEGGDGRTQINRQLVKEKWEQGMTCKQIANELNIWSSSVIEILKELNIYDYDEVAYRKSIDIANSQAEKRIIQYDEEGNIVQYYNSVLEASRAINGIASSIQSAITCKGSRYGYFWVREGDSLPAFHKIIQPKIRKIYQYDMDYNLINEFETAAEAARILNVSSPSSILKVCKGQRKTAYGYYWSYERR